MKIAFFSTKSFDRTYFDAANATFGHDIHYIEHRLTVETAKLAAGHEVVCAFANDCLDGKVNTALKDAGVQLVALRSAGFNHVDLEAAEDCGLTVVRVPAYSPNSVAEHSVALMLSLNRKIHRAYNRVREGNFELDGLLGFDFVGKTVGVIGTGKIGSVVARIMKLGFGCDVVAFDPLPNEECLSMGVEYVDKRTLLNQSDVVTLHCPLNSDTHYIIDKAAINKMKTGVMLINTSRGGLLDTHATIQALKSQKIGYLGIDVYEEESQLFFKDRSEQVLSDDIFARLLTFPNVLVTGHQAFFTLDAIQQIAVTTLDNVTRFSNNDIHNEVCLSNRSMG